MAEKTVGIYLNSNFNFLLFWNSVKRTDFNSLSKEELSENLPFLIVDGIPLRFQIGAKILHKQSILLSLIGFGQSQ